MKFSRRDFIHAGCAVTVASLVPDQAEAWIDGVAVAAANANRVTLNVTPGNNAAAYSNMAKGFTLRIPFANAPNSDGYPTVVTASDIISNPQFLIGYFGDYIEKWSGECSINIPWASLVRLTELNGVPTGGVAGGVAGTSGDATALTILNQTNPRVQFTLGATVQGVTQGAVNGAGGNYIRLTFKTGYVDKFSGLGSAQYQVIKVQNSTQSGVGNISVAGAIGTWNYVKVDSSNIDLTTDAVTGAVSVWTTNGIAGGEAITTPNNVNVDILGSANGATSYAGFSNYVFCTTGNEAAVDAGQYWAPGFVANLQYLCNHASAPMSDRAWLRFMDYSQVQASWEADFTNRSPPTALTWTAGSPPVYTTTSANAAITNTGISGAFTDAYACADATTSVWSETDYIDNACIQGTIAASNSGGLPSLNVGGNGARPIFDQVADMLFMPFTAAPAASVATQIDFQASWLNGGSTFTFNYKTSAGATFTLTAAGGSNQAVISELTGTLEVNQLVLLPGGGGAFITDVGTTGGGNGTYTFDRTISARSGSGQVLNDTASANAGATAMATALNVFFPTQFCGLTGNSIACWWRTAQAGVLTFAKVAGSSVFTITRMSIGAITTGPAYLVYNAMAGGWLYVGNVGFTRSAPLEPAVQLANTVGAHLWWNWPVYTQAAYITAVTNFFADPVTGLTSGLKFGTEVGNEVWRIGGNQLAVTTNLGFMMTFPNGSNATNYGWVAMRTIQSAALSRAAWTGKGRTLSDHYIIQQGREADYNVGSNFDVNGLRGTTLTASNTVYSTYGGFGGTPTGPNNASPNRPCDIINACGFADYWFSDYIREDTQEIFGSVTDNSAWLQASKDYANGNTATAFAAMANMVLTQRGSATIASASYNSGTGVLALTLSATINQGTLAPPDIIHLYNLTGTGSFAFLLNGGNGWSSISPTSGTTISLNVGTGRTFTLTGGVAVDETASGVNPSQAANLSIYSQLYWLLFESCLAQYDNSAGRATNGVNALIANIHYEGAPQWSISGNIINGTNSTTDYVDLVNRITALGWNVSAYTVSGTNNITEVSQQVVNLIQGWKHDTDHTGAAANTASYKNLIKTHLYEALKAATVAGREVKGAQYGLDGTSTWTLSQGLFTQNNPYTNYDAIHEFNA